MRSKAESTKLVRNLAKDLVIIMPCKNEADNLKIVVAKLWALQPVAIIIGLDPGTTDDTQSVAEKLGCHIVHPNRGGYDPAVHAATTYALENYEDSLLLYTDAGDKYGYQQVPTMVAMVNSGSEMVMGIRTDIGNTMHWHQKLGTQLVLVLINLCMKQRIRDISPFRLVQSSVFDRVTMEPQKYRWPSELLVKSLACNLKVSQVTIVPLPRRGTSKVSGSIRNSIQAGYEMFSSLQFVSYSMEHIHNQEAEYVSEKR